MQSRYATTSNVRYDKTICFMTSYVRHSERGFATFEFVHGLYFESGRWHTLINIRNHAGPGWFSIEIILW